MNEFVEITVPVLEWLQPKTLESRFTLHASGALAATLVFPRVLGTLAEAATAAGKWSFKRVGFWQTHVTIRRDGSGQDEAVFVPKLLGSGTLRFADGTEYAWGSLNFWDTRWAFSARGGAPLLTLQQGVEGSTIKDALKTQVTVRVEQDLLRHPHAALLACLGMYLRVMMEREAAAATVVLVS